MPNADTQKLALRQCLAFVVDASCCSRLGSDVRIRTTLSAQRVVFDPTSGCLESALIRELVISEQSVRLVILLTTCLAATAGAQGHYIRQPAKSVVVDSTAEAVVTYFDERVLAWLNVSLIRLREDFVESGACLRIAQRFGQDAFTVDSVIEPTLDENDPPPTWRSARFTCPDSFAPIHWHVITPADAAWLYANGDTTGDTMRGRCRVSDPDRSSFWSRFPFAAMQCGIGIDSITVYRVKAR